LSDRRAFATAAAVFVLIAGAMSAITAWIYADRVSHLERSTDIVAGQARAFLSAWIDARLTAVADLADRAAAAPNGDPAAFGRDARQLLERWPGLRAIGWVDLSGVIRVTVPEDGNLSASNSNLFDHSDPDVGRALAEAVAGRVSRMKAVSLPQGGSGFAVYWPVRTPDGRVAGVVNSVFGAQALMAASRLAEEIGDEHWLELRDPGGSPAWSNAPEPASEWRLASTDAVSVLDFEWFVSIAPTPARIRTTVAGPQLVTLLGTSWLLAGLLALAAWRRVQIDERARRRARTIREVFEQLPHPIFLTDARGRLEFVNRAMVEISGRSRDQLLGAGAEALPMASDQAEAFDRAGAAVIAAHEPRHDDVVLTGSDGRRRMLEIVRAPFRAPLDDAPAVLGVGVEVTERHEQEALRRHIANALDQAGEAIAVLDMAGRIEFANAAFTHMMGMDGRDVRGLGAEAFAVIGSDDDRLISEVRETLRRGEPWKRRYTSRWHDGERVRDATVTPFRDEAGRLAGYVAVLRDLTREAQLEAELRQAQKLEAVGRLSGGIAHDFNNLLTVILGFAEMLRDEVEPGGAAAKAAAEIEAAAGRAAELTRQLLTFSRRGAATASADLNAVVRGMMAMLERLIGEDIAVAVHLTDGAMPVAADRGEIEQILVNLCLNARDAMPGGGHLTITTERAAVEQGPVGLGARGGAGRFVVLRVADDGIGMPPEIKQRIFEPFFTTKEVGAGTGLGLSTAYGIVEQRGGALQVESAPGAGTRMSVWLPAADLPDGEGVEAAQPPAAAGQPAATILVVEDEAAIRSLMTRTLILAGYRVISAEDGVAALARVESEPDIDLLVSDLVMPRMGGLELRDRLSRSRPGLRVLFVSGYAPDAGTSSRLGAHDRLLHKPFRPPALLDAVAEGLAAR
jgi:two-component system, cell cycle sensor histidine kinase and response regulator CckA